MARPYNPKTDLYTAPRIQKEFKSVLKDIEGDREKAWQAYEYFKALVESNPDDMKAKTEMVKCLEIYTNTKMKALDSLVKIRVHLDKTPAPDKNAENLEMLSFDDLKQKKYH
jgi:adenosyl cobinamide kinase/adenosyl cobinamide phosphate guanylyltransferase